MINCSKLLNIVQFQSAFRSPVPIEKAIQYYSAFLTYVCPIYKVMSHFMLCLKIKADVIVIFSVTASCNDQVASTGMVGLVFVHVILV